MSEKIRTLMAGQWRDASGPACTTEYPADGSKSALYEREPLAE